MNPRSGGVYFEIYAGTSGVIFLQHIADGGQPSAIFNSLAQSCESFGDVGIPNIYDRNSIDNLIANVDFSNDYNKKRIDTIITNQTYTSSEHIGITYK